MVFHTQGTWKAHLDHILQVANRSSNAIKHFFYTGGGQLVPAALKLFEAKTLAQILYGAQAGILVKKNSLESIQTKFLRAILAAPKGTSNAQLRIETGMPQIQIRAWKMMIIYWLKMHFYPEGLSPLVLTDNFPSPWKQAIDDKLGTYGLSSLFLMSLDFDQAQQAVINRMKDMEFQEEQNRLPFSSRDKIKQGLWEAARYLGVLTSPKQRIAFFRARFNILPSALLQGRYMKTPIAERVCICGKGEVEDVSHVLLYCELYRDHRKAYILPLLNRLPGRTDNFYVSFLLQDSDSFVTHIVAKFCVVAMWIRKKLVTEL